MCRGGRVALWGDAPATRGCVSSRLKPWSRDRREHKYAPARGARCRPDPRHAPSGSQPCDTSGSVGQAGAKRSSEPGRSCHAQARRSGSFASRTCTLEKPWPGSACPGRQRAHTGEGTSCWDGAGERKDQNTEAGGRVGPPATCRYRCSGASRVRRAEDSWRNRVPSATRCSPLRAEAERGLQTFVNQAAQTFFVKLLCVI